MLSAALIPADYDLKEDAPSLFARGRRSPRMLRKHLPGRFVAAASDVNYNVGVAMEIISEAYPPVPMGGFFIDPMNN